MCSLSQRPESGQFLLLYSYFNVSRIGVGTECIAGQERAGTERLGFRDLNTGWVVKLLFTKNEDVSNDKFLQPWKISATSSWHLGSLVGVFVPMPEGCIHLHDGYSSPCTCTLCLDARAQIRVQNKAVPSIIPNRGMCAS